MKKILVVGGAGYIGGYLSDLLLRSGHDITVYDNLMFENKITDALYGAGGLSSTAGCPLLLAGSSSVIPSFSLLTGL